MTIVNLHLPCSGTQPLPPSLTHTHALAQLARVVRPASGGGGGGGGRLLLLEHSRSDNPLLAAYQVGAWGARALRIGSYLILACIDDGDC